ncbi:N-acetylneuraminate synthase [Candidatus Margulisiibacteriota bacterium]
MLQKKGGADAVKFQTFKAENLVTQQAKTAVYQKENAKYTSQYDMLKTLELSYDDFKTLSDYAKKKDIIFLSTPFDEESAAFLNSIGIPVYKIGSGEVTNLPLLKKIAGFKKPIILSTGMSSIPEIKKAVRTLIGNGTSQLALLHCTSNYPAQIRDVNLRAMDTLKKTFKLPVGYSDHTEGIEVSLAAVARGAVVVEKHFTLDKSLPGPDHKASSDPAELAAMIEGIRIVETALGSADKKILKSEVPVKKVAQKSIVALETIPAGTIVTEEMITVKRPAGGIAPADMSKVVGGKAKNTIKKDECIKWAQISGR